MNVTTNDIVSISFGLGTVNTGMQPNLLGSLNTVLEVTSLFSENIGFDPSEQTLKLSDGSILPVS